MKTRAHVDFTIVAKLCRTASRDNVGLYIVALIVKWMGSLVSQGVLCWVSWHIGSNGPFQPVYISVAGIPPQVMCRSIAAPAYLHLQVTRSRLYKLPRHLTLLPVHESSQQNDPIKRTSCYGHAKPSAILDLSLRL